MVQEDGKGKIDWGSGKKTKLMPKFEKYLDRSPIELGFDGRLILTRETKYSASQTFRKKMYDVGLAKFQTADEKESREFLKIDDWLPYSDKILKILEEVFVKSID